MRELYSKEDLASLKSQLQKRWLAVWILLGLAVAVFVFSMVIRLEWLSMASVIVFGFFAVFWIDLFCLPLMRYRRLVEAALFARNHTDTLEYVRTEPDPSMVDGVSCMSLIFLGEPDKHGTRETLFYWDAEIPAPALEAGKEYTFRYTGKNIIALDA